METAATAYNNGLIFANFNQDFGCFVVVTGQGFRIFNADPLREKEARLFPLPSNDESQSESVALEAAVGLERARIVKAEMLFRCNYLALVIAPLSEGTSGVSLGHKVVIWDDLKQMGVIHLDFNAEVRGVRLRRDRIVVVLKSMIKVYTFTAPPQQLHVFDTAPNSKGLCSLSPSSANSLLAFPASASDVASGNNQAGNVKLIDLANVNKRPLVIPAHAAHLSYLTLNIQGTLLATSSDKGTLIRIFDTVTGNLINELRRGTQPATIYSVNFSPDSSLLVVSSSHGTIHVFSAVDSSKNKHSSLVSTATSMMVNLFGASSSNGSSVHQPPASSSLNKFVPKYFTSEWSFSRIEVPGATRCIVAFSGFASSTVGAGAPNCIGNDFAVLAVCEDGSYHKFVYDKKKEAFVRDVYQMLVENDATQ